MLRKKMFLCLALCLTLLLTTASVFAAAGNGGGVDPRAITGTSGGFVRVKALKGELTISAFSSTQPDNMYAQVMLQRNVGGTWTNYWSNYITIADDNPAASAYGAVRYITVEDSGTYRCKVYVTEVDDGVTNTVGPDYSQSASL